MANLTDTTIFRSLNSETPMYNADNVDTLINGLSTTYAKKADVYTKTEVDGKIADASSKVYRFKGSVATYQDLPTTGLTVGDVYNVEDSGKNYAWTGSGSEKVGDGWDDIGGVVDLSVYYTKTETDTLLGGKVDKEVGKGLSTNDYTTAEKTKLANIAEGAQVNVIESVKVKGSDGTTSALPVTSKSVTVDLSGLVAKEAGKGLSTNDYTTAEKDKLSNVADGAQVNVIESVKVNGTALPINSKSVNIDLSTPLANKVDKVEGKGLSTNDYTTTEKTKLSGIEEGAEVNQNAFSGIKVGATTVSAASKTDTVELKAGSNVTLSASGKVITINAAATDISGKANKAAFASLADLESWPTSNYNLETLVTKYNALIEVLKAIASAV